MRLIHIENLSTHFRILSRREGLRGAFRDLFSGDSRTVEAVAGISFDIGLFALTYWIWMKGVNSYTGTGS